MLTHGLVKSALKQRDKNKQDKRDAEIAKKFGDESVKKVLVLERLSTVYTDTFYIYDDTDSIKYTASDYTARSEYRNIRLYDDEANIIGTVEETSRINSESGGTSRLRLYIGGRYIAELTSKPSNKSRKAELTNGWSVEGPVMGGEFTIFLNGEAVVQVYCKHRFHVFNCLTDTICFYEDVDEIMTLMTVLAYEVINLANKDFSSELNNNDKYKDIMSYVDRRGELKRRRDLRQSIFNGTDVE